MLYALIIFVAIAIAATVFIYTGVMDLKDLFTSGILPLFATYLGAFFAFKLNEDKETSKLQATRREALNRTLFVLARQRNAIHQLKKDFDRFSSPLEKAINLPAFKPPAYSDLIHNFADLEFLLESPEPNLLFKLTIEQERFHQAIDSINIRNEFYVNEMQPALANLQGVRFEEVEKLLDKRLFGQAMNGAKNAYELICACNKCLPALHTEMRKLAKTTFLGHKFLDFEIPT